MMEVRERETEKKRKGFPGEGEKIDYFPYRRVKGKTQAKKNIAESATKAGGRKGKVQRKRVLIMTRKGGKN